MTAAAAVRGPDGSGWARLPLALAAALALVAMFEFGFSAHRAEGLSDRAAALTRLTTGRAAGYEQALARADLAIAGAAGQARARPGEWLVGEAEARAWQARARLSGDFADYARAEAAFARAFAVADPGTGPHLSAAAFAFSLHRLDDAARMLDWIEAYAVPPAAGDRAEALGLRGDIALYRGDYAGALARYREAEAAAPGSAAFRIAVYHSHLGAPEQADREFARYAAGMRNPSPQAAAHVELQRGILDLDNGRLAEALVHFRRADALFPGHWLIEEHIAEVLTLTSRDAEAEPIYAAIVRRTGHPEFVDALAAIAARRGDAAEAARLTALAARGWDARLRQHPLAAYGHAIDHCLQARRPRCALDLARRNLRARPYGGAELKLAEALILSGRRHEAARIVDRVAATGWRPADVAAVRAQLAQ